MPAEPSESTDFPAVPAPHFIGLRSGDRSGRPLQLFLETPPVSAPVFFQACGTPWQEGAGPRPADGDLISDLKGDFGAQYLGYLVAVAVEMECRLGSGRRSFFEQHDAVTGIAA